MIWHILKKDLRRLAVPIAITLALLTALSVIDSWRHDFQAGLAETVLNLLVPLAWSVLIALAVQLEPLTTDTAFWLTRPYRRTSLLLAKIAFALVAVHVPLLISHAGILLSHGFAPFHPELWWKQLTVLLGITIPSLAIASMTSTIAGFGWCALAAGTTALLMDTALIGQRYPWIQADWMPGALALLLLAIGGVVIIALQYTKRTTWTGRAIGLVVAIAAVLTFSFLPRDFTAELQCSVEPDAPQAVALRFKPEADVQRIEMPRRPDRMPISLPLEVSGLENARHVWVDQLSLRLVGANGQNWETRRELGLDRRAVLRVDLEQRGSVQHVVPDRNFVQALGDSPVRIEGRASVRPVRALPRKVMPSSFEWTDVPNLGRCMATHGMEMWGQQMLKVVCESPAPIPMLTRVQMIDPVSGREWKHGLGDASSSHLPTIVWLSPLNRRQTHLQIVERESQFAGDRWLVPRHIINRSQIHIEPWIAQGCANVQYAFDVPNLRHWEVRDPR